MSLIIISIIIIYVSYFIIIIIFMIRNSSLFRIRAERDGTLHRGPIRSTRSTWAPWPKEQLRAATATPRRAIRTAAQAAPHVDLRSGASARRPGHLGQGPAAPPPCPLLTARRGARCKQATSYMSLFIIIHSYIICLKPSPFCYTGLGLLGCLSL